MLTASATGFLIVICILILVKMMKVKMQYKEAEMVNQINSVESLQYDFETIKHATEDFSDANKLGQGGFRVVYKGKLPSGEEIAVKWLSRVSEQGKAAFKNEVMLMAKLQHRNLVRLLGFCLDRTERLLVYEFVINSILDPLKRAHLDWGRRRKIIRGIARGILYLHDDSRLRIIHCDLKAGNVMLDAEMNPKIADFGIARLFVMDETQGSTSTIVGTHGYMAPEYVMHGVLSVKTDVFTFGILILEIISGQMNNGFRHGERTEGLSSYAWRNWREGTSSNLIDPLLISSSNWFAVHSRKCCQSTSHSFGCFSNRVSSIKEIIHPYLD